MENDKSNKKMSIKLNNSGPAIFMYSVIAICLITSIICFILYYGNHTDSQIVLWEVVLRALSYGEKGG